MSKTKAYFGNTPNMLKRLVLRDGPDCWLCGKPVDMTNHGRKRASKDHVIRRRNGGPSCIENYKLAHADCNSRRERPLFKVRIKQGRLWLAWELNPKTWIWRVKRIPTEYRARRFCAKLLRMEIPDCVKGETRFTPGEQPEKFLKAGIGKCYPAALTNHKLFKYDYAEGMGFRCGVWFHHAWNVVNGFAVEASGDVCDAYVGQVIDPALLAPYNIETIHSHGVRADLPDLIT